VQPRHPPLLVMDDRVPDERAVAEQPYVRARLVPVENLTEGGFLLRVGEHPHLRIEPAKRRPQQVVLEVGAGEGHATRLSPQGASGGPPRPFNVARTRTAAIIQGPNSDFLASPVRGSGLLKIGGARWNFSL